MSDTNFYQPHVFIDGIMIGESRTTNKTAAIADIKIDWGTEDWFTPVEPSTLKVQILDYPGSLINTSPGVDIKITRDPENVVVWRGKITSFVSELRTVDSGTGSQLHYWIHSIVAKDRLHDLENDRARGNMYANRDFSPARMHWGPGYMAERKAELDRRAGVNIWWQWTSLDQYDGVIPILFFPVASYELSDTVSCLTVLQNTARISNTYNRVFYFHARNEIRFLSLDALNYAELVMYEEPFFADLTSSSSNMTLLDGSLFSMPSKLTYSSDSRNSVTGTELKLRTTQASSFSSSDQDRYLENVSTSKNIKPISDSPVQVTYSCTSDHSNAFWYEQPESNFYTQSNLVLSALDATIKAPKIAYKFNKHFAAPTWAIDFLSPEPPLTDSGRLKRYDLIKSVTNRVPKIGNFCILGGTLSYTNKSGWVAELNNVQSGGFSRDNPALELGDVSSSLPIGLLGSGSTVSDWQRVMKVL